MLRVSGEIDGKEYDARAATQADADSGVPHGRALTAFAEAAVTGDAAQLETSRDALAHAMSEEAVVDAAAVVGNFERMVRIADATGIPLDRPLAIFSADLREELGIDTYGSAEHTPRVGGLMRAVARLAKPLLIPIMSRYAKSQD